MRLVSCALFVIMFFMNYYNNVSGVEMSYIDTVCSTPNAYLMQIIN